MCNFLPETHSPSSVNIPPSQKLSENNSPASPENSQRSPEHSHLWPEESTLNSEISLLPDSPPDSPILTQSNLEETLEIVSWPSPSLSVNEVDEINSPESPGSSLISLQYPAGSPGYKIYGDDNVGDDDGDEDVMLTFS